MPENKRLIAPNEAPGGIVLAAGASRRLGQPKQLLIVDGQPLVRRTAQTLLDAGMWPVVIVLGAYAREVRAACITLPVLTIDHASWEEGVGASLRVGIETLDRFSTALPGAVVVPCDLPFLCAANIARLHASLSPSDLAAAAHYEGVLGPPTWFRRSCFPALRAARGDVGARAWLRENAAHVAEVPMPELAHDLDTPDDVVRFHRARAPGGITPEKAAS
jgi:molybdenum cofactor cytidylyltransferase